MSNVMQGLKTRHFSFSGLYIQSYSTIYLLQNTFNRIKISFSNWSYTRLINTIKETEKIEWNASEYSSRAGG